MENKWVISKGDIQLVKQICLQQSNQKIYQERLSYNLGKCNFKIDRELIWKTLFLCLLTTQQRSSENSPINNFIKTDYSQVSYNILSGIDGIQEYILRHLKGFGGIRRTQKVSEELEIIYEYLNVTEWNILEDIQFLQKNKGNKQLERALANKISENKDFKGLGPKQSRNFLQMLGITAYEIPIDSRITDWLNDNQIFPFKINSIALSDMNFYCFLNDAIIELCKEADIEPCLFDAAVFSLKG